eukprot:360555-Chlamydomonas_euryale.AAC.5
MPTHVRACSLLGGYSVTERVFLDIDVDGARAGRVVVGVHGSAVPRAGVNFTELASHVRGYGYRGCAFYDVVPRFAVVGGDVTKVCVFGGEREALRLCVLPRCAALCGRQQQRHNTSGGVCGA